MPTIGCPADYIFVMFDRLVLVRPMVVTVGFFTLARRLFRHLGRLCFVVVMPMVVARDSAMRVPVARRHQLLISGCR